MSSHPPSAFDMYIVERIIKALEVVTEMNSDMERLKEMMEKHDKALGADAESLPMKLIALQGQFTNLLAEFKMMHTAMQEKQAHDAAQAVANTSGEWGMRGAIIAAITAVVTSLITALSVWLN